MDVRLLGQIEAIDGDSLPLAGPTQRRVLAALALRRNEVVSVAHLVDVIWPDREPPDRAEHNVRTYVHRLRSSLNGSDERIETVGSGYRLRLETDELDAAKFERLAGNVARLAGTGDSIEALDAVDEAERLWLGDPIEEFEHEPWAVAETVRLRELHTELRTQRASMLLDLGRPADAVAALEALIREEPLRERPRALLMRALYESGRQAEALRAYQDFRRLLVDEVGVGPSPDLVELDQAIATGDLPASRAEGRTVGNYELVERIGEGAFAVVHRATQASLGRDVAVKVVRAEFANRPEFIRRFEAEAQMVAAIEHPNVVPLYDFWREPDSAFLVMRWMAGGSLETRLDAGPWSLDDTVDLVDQIAAALTAAHGHGVVHRDVKPGNILFDESGRAYLGDFGIALSAEEQATPQAALSEGSPVFASPEQLRREPVGPEADVHALAIVAFTVLTGRTPFADSPDEATMLRRQLDEPIPPISTLVPGLPVVLDAVLATATAKLPGERYASVFEFAAAFRAAASGDVATQPERPLGEQRINPYLGLRAFSESDAGVFYGRDRLTEELAGHLATPDQNMIAVVGPSGSGKSSVVRAGLIPALRQGRVPRSDQWFTTMMIPGSHPFESLETALLRVAINPPGSLIDQLRDGDRGVLRGVRRILPDDDGVLLIVIDQFEEIFTSDVPEAERDQFLRALAVAVTEPVSPVRVVLTLRADFYDEPLRHPQFAPLIKRHTVTVTPLAADELEEAITRPAAEVGVGFESGLVAEMAADVNSQPGALPLLQFALTRAFDQSDGPTISIDDYRTIGGLSGALARRAEDVWQNYEPEEREAARRLFGRLVTLGEGTEDTRRRVGRSELPRDPATDVAIDRFGQARLLTFDHNPATREPTVEVAHEALIREWQRLSEWLDDDRDTLRVHRHLTVAAAGWADRERDRNELYRGARLDASATLLTTDIVALNEIEADFLRASVRCRDEELVEEHRRLQRLRRLVAATAVVAAIALLAGALALVQWRRADDQAADAATNAELAAGSAREAGDRAAEAEQARGEAESAALIADEERARADENAGLADERADEAEAARQQADLERLRAVALATAPERPTVAALLAVEAHRIDPSVESLDAIHRTLTAVPGVQGVIPNPQYWELELLADGTTAVAVGGTLDVWDVERREVLRSFSLPTLSVIPMLDVSLDGTTAVVRTGSVDVAVFDLETGDVTGTFSTGSGINDVSLSRDGALVALAQANGVVTLLDSATFERRAVLDSGESSVSLVDWSPTEDAIAVVTSVSTTQVWEAATGEQRWAITPAIEFPALNGVPTGILHSSDGRLVVVESGSLSPVLHTYSTSDGLQPYAPTSRSDGANGVDALMWIDEDRLLLGAGNTRGAAVYDLATGEDVGERIGNLVVNDAVFVPGLREIVAIGSSRLHFRSIDGAGPLERVALLTDEQRSAVVERGGSVHTSIAADGSRLVVSVLDGAQLTRTTSFDLTTDPMTLGDFPFIDRSAFGNGEYTMTFDTTPPQFELLDRFDEPVGAIPITSLDVIDQDASADGRFMAVARTGGFVDLYDGSGTLLRELDMELPASSGGLIVIPSLTDDGEYVSAVATGAGGFDTAVWSTDTYERVDDGRFGGQSRLVGDLLANRVGNEVQLYRVPSFEPFGPPMINESGGMFYPAIDTANGRLAVTSQNNVTVYDIESGQQLGRALPYRPIRIEFTEDGSQLAVASDDRVTVWNYDTDAWPGIVCEAAGRNLTREEWEQFGPRTVEYRATCEQYELPG